MKILISIGTLGLGGAEKQAVWLANRLSEEHEVTLLTYHGGAREKDISSRIAWKTIFDDDEEEKVTEQDSGQLVADSSIIPFEAVGVEKQDLNHVIENECACVCLLPRTA